MIYSNKTMATKWRPPSLRRGSQGQKGIVYLNFLQNKNVFSYYCANKETLKNFAGGLPSCLRHHCNTNILIIASLFHY